MASEPLRAVRSPLLRWWLSLLHAVNRQFRFVKVKTATRPEIRSTFLTALFLRKESSVVIFYGPF